MLFVGPRSVHAVTHGLSPSRDRDGSPSLCCISFSRAIISPTGTMCCLLNVLIVHVTRPAWVGNVALHTHTVTHTHTCSDTHMSNREGEEEEARQGTHHHEREGHTREAHTLAPPTPTLCNTHCSRASLRLSGQVGMGSCMYAMCLLVLCAVCLACVVCVWY